MLELSGKTDHFQLSHIPKRSGLSDANKNRKVGVFEDIYNKLLKQYGSILSDSRINASAESFNAKVKAFRSQFRGVKNIEFFLFRLTNIYA